MKSTLYWEDKRHGTPDFPVAFYRVDPAHPQYVMPLHRHRECELVRVLRGRLRLFVNNIEYPGQAGDLFFIGSGELHRAEPEDCLYECAVFDLGFLGRPGSAVSAAVQPLLLGQAQVERALTDDALRQPAAQLFSCLRDKPAHYPLAAHSLLSQLVYRLYAQGLVHTARVSRQDHRQAIIAELLEWIDTHYAQKLTLGTLAQVAAVHEKYLCRIFKEYTGHTPMDYVNQIRIERACVALVRDHRTVTQAALECGFSDTGYFSRQFRLRKGMTPREYRAAREG